MLKIFSKGLMFLVPFWIIGMMLVGAYSFVTKATHPLIESFLSEKMLEEYSTLVKIGEFSLVIILVFIIGLILSQKALRGLLRAIIGRLPFIGALFSSYFKLEDKLTGVNGEKEMVLISDDEGYHYLGIHTGEADGKAIVYCPSFPALTGSIILVPHEKLIDTDLTFAEAMKIFTTLGLTHINY